MISSKIRKIYICFYLANKIWMIASEIFEFCEKEIAIKWLRLPLLRLFENYSMSKMQESNKNLINYTSVPRPVIQPVTHVLTRPWFLIVFFRCLQRIAFESSYVLILRDLRIFLKKAVFFTTNFTKSR